MIPALRPDRVEALPEADEPPPPTRPVGGVAIAAIDAAAALRLLARRIDRIEFTRLAFANAHCVNVAQDSGTYREGLADFLVLPDGVGVDLASKILFGAPFPENLNGTDFVPRLLRFLSGRRSVGLIGAAPGVAETVARNLRAALPQHEFRVISHGFFKDGLETEIVLARLRRFSPDVTLIALSVPRQELFIAQHLTVRETTVAVGVGALFDFLSGRIVRAPKSWRALRLEWLFRLTLEPARLWRRYVLGNPRFLLRVLVDRLRLGRRTLG